MSTARDELAARQAALVAALVTGSAPPAGVDPHRVEVAANALLRKRAGEVAHAWPTLLATPSERAAFVTWARGRPRASSFVEGWDFACHLEATGALTPPGATALAAVRRRWTRDPGGAPRRRARWRIPRAGGRGAR